MRIIGYIEHSTYMITVFNMDDKFSIKFEKNLLEQTYKYRGGSHMSGIEDIQKIVTPEFLQKVDAVFQSMEATRLNSLKVDSGEDGFEGIV